MAGLQAIARGRRLGATDTRQIVAEQIASLGGRFNLDLHDEIIVGALITYDGHVKQEET